MLSNLPEILRGGRRFGLAVERDVKAVYVPRHVGHCLEPLDTWPVATMDEDRKLLTLAEVVQILPLAGSRAPVHVVRAVWPDEGIMVVRIESCRDADTGRLSRVAQSILERFFQKRYIEVMPGGRGLQIWGMGDMPKRSAPRGSAFLVEGFLPVTGERVYDTREIQHGTEPTLADGRDAAEAFAELLDASDTEPFTDDEVLDCLNGIWMPNDRALTGAALASMGDQYQQPWGRRGDTVGCNDIWLELKQEIKRGGFSVPPCILRKLARRPAAVAG